MDRVGPINMNQADNKSNCHNGSSQDIIKIVSPDSEKISIDDYAGYVRRLKHVGQTLRSDKNKPSLSEKPDWFDEELFQNAKLVYANNFMGINFAHFAGLILLVRIDSVYKTLVATGESARVSKLFRRYFQTVMHVKSWYEGDIFDSKDKAHQSLLIVRGMHDKASRKLNDLNNNNDDVCHEKSTLDANGNTMVLSPCENAKNQADSFGVHISEYDLMLTQVAFLGFILTRPTNVGLIDSFSRYDAESIIHFWRVIGFYLGATDRFNLCSYEYDQVIALCRTFMGAEYRESLSQNQLDTSPGIMSVNIIRSIKFVPMLTVYAMVKYLSEILDYEPSMKELIIINQRRTWYSRLSYTLMTLVMTRLLAYKPFRSFNNGLTRLSLYCVAGIEDWFSNRLDKTYTTELKL